MLGCGVAAVQSFPEPGPIGRLVRVGAGVAALVLAILELLSYRAYFHVGVPTGGWWILLAVSILSLPDMIDGGLGFSLKYWSQVAVGVVLVVAAVVSVVAFRNVWGPPLGAVIYVLTAVVWVYMGVSFLVAAWGAAPGCEMGAIPTLLARRGGRQHQPHF